MNNFNTNTAFNAINDCLLNTKNSVKSFNTVQMTNYIKNDNLNANLIYDMANTASLLSKQLLDLHRSIVKSTTLMKFKTPQQCYSDNYLTPVSSGYNSVKSSNENLLNDSLNMNNQSANFASKRTSLSTSSLISNISTESSVSMSSFSSERNNIRKNLFKESPRQLQKFVKEKEAIDVEQSVNAVYLTPQTNMINESNRPKIPRIKETRKDLFKKRSNKLLSLVKRSSFRKFIGSASLRNKSTSSSISSKSSQSGHMSANSSASAAESASSMLFSSPN